MQRLCAIPNKFLCSSILITASVASSFASPNLTGNEVTQSSSASAEGRIDEAMFVRIGGIEQWVTIKGDDRNNPVVLFLHGGPGDALSPFADAMLRGWQKEFTLVQWDQRGAGRTYAKTGQSIASTMTIDRMVKDGIELSEYLTHRLHKKKIIITGGSWGSILGTYMAHARPDLFYAYIGTAQIVNWQKDLAASYARVLEMASTSDNQQAITALTSIGPPPWNSIAKWPIYRKWEQIYQAKVVTAPPALPFDSALRKLSPQERAQYEAADDFSFMHFWGPTLSGPLTKVDLPALGTEFSIPIFIIQGQEDLTASPELAKGYFESIRAPRKQFYLVPGTGHEDSAASLDMILKVLIEQVRPISLEH